MASTQLYINTTTYAVPPSGVFQVWFDAFTSSLGSTQMTVTATVSGRYDGFTIIKDSTYLLNGTISGFSTAGYFYSWIEVWYEPNAPNTTWEIVSSAYVVGTQTTQQQRLTQSMLVYLRKDAKVRFMCWHNNATSWNTSAMSLASAIPYTSFSIAPTMPLT
jgi:hypothetical protein